MDWAAGDLPERDLYKLLVNTILPRPIALVSTVNREGRANAAPFSFFNVFSHAPPLVVLGIESRDRGDGPHKDTIRNIRDTGSFVVNLVDRALMDAMLVCAIDFPHDVDEISAAGLTIEKSRTIPAPRIGSSPVQFECTETVSLSLGVRYRNLVIGEVKHIHVRDGIVDEKLHVDIDKLDLVGRLHGADWYVGTKDRFRAPRRTMDDWQTGRDNKAEAAEGG